MPLVKSAAVQKCYLRGLCRMQKHQHQTVPADTVAIVEFYGFYSFRLANGREISIWDKSIVKKYGVGQLPDREPAEPSEDEFIRAMKW